MFTLQTLFYYIGVGVVAYYVALLVTRLYDVFIKSGLRLEKFGAGQGAWAVVTGCTDGLGRETALELASRGFNLVLISRTQEKLDATADEIQQLTGGSVKTRTIAVDFAKMTNAQWDLIQQEMNSVWVGVLVNNVGVCTDYPMYIEEVKEVAINSLVELNVRTMIKMTRTVLPQMKGRQSGLILNMGSFSALLPCPLLSVYSGTKGFVKYFSQSLAAEVEQYGVVVDHIQTFYVCGKMSGFKKPNLFIPMPKPFIKQMLGKIGAQCGTSEPYTTVPYFSHVLMAFVVEHVFPMQMALDFTYSMLDGFNKRKLNRIQRKQEELLDGVAPVSVKSRSPYGLTELFIGCLFVIKMKMCRMLAVNSSNNMKPIV